MKSVLNKHRESIGENANQFGLRQDSSPVAQTTQALRTTSSVAMLSAFQKENILLLNRVLLGLVLAIGFLGLIGHYFDIPNLRSLGTSTPILLPTAYALVSLSITGLLILTIPRAQTPCRQACLQIGSLVVTWSIGLYFLTALMMQVGFHLELLLTQRMTWWGMTLIGAISLVLSCIALTCRYFGRVYLVQVFGVGIPALLLLCIHSFALLGHINDIPMLYASYMSIPSSLGYLLFSLILLIDTIPSRGLFSPLFSSVNLVRWLSLGALVIGGFLMIDGFMDILRLHSVINTSFQANLGELTSIYLNDEFSAIGLFTLVVTVIMMAIYFYEQSLFSLQCERQAEARFRQVVEVGILGFVFWNKAGEITDANDAFLDMVGYSREELEQGRINWREMTPPEYAYLDERAFIQMESYGKCEPYEKQYITKDGRRIDIQLSVAYYHQSKQAGVAYILDITNQKRAEASLEDSEEQLRLITDALPVLISFIDKNLCYQFANKAYEVWFGYSVNQILGKSVYEVLGEKAMEGLKPYMVRALQGETVSFELTTPYHMGGTRTIHADYIPKFSSDNSVEGFFVLVADITQQKKAEQDLIDSRDRLQAAIDVAGMGTYRWNMQTGDVVWDSSLYQLFGVDESGPRGLQSFYELIHEDELDAVKAEIERCKQPDYCQFNLEYRIIRPDGQVRWILDKGAVRRDDDETPVYLTGACFDITEQKQYERALKESEERYRLILEGSNDGIWDWDMGNNVVYSNARYRDMIGLEEEDFSIDYFFSLIHPEDQPRVVDAVLAHMETSAAYDIEFRLLNKKTQSYVTVWSRGKVIKDEQGLPVRMSGLHTDLTERLRAQHALAESEARFRMLAESAPVIIWMTNAQNENEYVNASYLSLFGLSPEEALGNRWMDLVHIDDRKSYLKICEDAFRTKQSFKTEVRVYDVNHAVRWLLVVGVPRFTPQGEFLGFIGSCADITEQKQTEAELLLAREMAEIANQKKSEFLAMMSHELRTPLNAVLSYSKMMEMGLAGPVTEKQAKYLHNVGASGQHLLAVINDLLDVSKIEAGKMQIMPDWIDLEPVIADIQSMMMTLASKKNVALTFNLQPAIGRIYVDEYRFKQILVNLINNAIKFNKPHGDVVVQIRNEEQWLTVSVWDTGIGIPQSKLPELFHKFYQVDSSMSRRQEGTGLGLSLTKDLVELHGGVILVHSTEGVGTTFEVKLPLSPVSSEGIGIDQDQFVLIE